MNDKTLNENEKAILNALRENPELEKCILEMIEITHERITELENGDDAEEAVVSAIKKTGKTLLQEWAEKQKDRAEKAAKENKSLRPHEKKK
jgi:predicted HicB family RNase H-like nuclease